MRSQKLLIVSATMLACTSIVSMSFADDTKAPATTGATGASGASGTTGASGASTVTSQTVQTPSSPSVPTTSTTITTQGSGTGSTATTPATTTPTSTTTTTSADDVSAASASPVVSMSPPPSGESTTVYAKRTPNKAVLITGTSLLVSTYVTTAALAGANGSVADKDLYIPIVGPWINIGDRPSSTRSDATRDTLLIAGSGVLQGIGAVMAVSSFFIPEKVPAARISAGNVKMEVMPTAAAGSAGLGAIGTF